MKRVILILIFAGFLTACGGGGGGAAPSVNSDDSPLPEETRRLTPAEQAEVRTAANRLRSDLDSLENNAEADSLRQEIDALIADINAARHTIEELQNEIANLRSEIDTLKVAETQTEPPPPNCGANEEIIGGSCKCISGYVRKNNICEPESPPLNCGANEKISGQNCVCVDGYRLNANGACICIDSSRRNANGMCDMTPPNCGANEIADGQNCVCVDGYQRNNSGMCEMIPPNCGANEEESNGICKCISGYVQQNGACELPPPNCDANEMVDGQNCICVDGYQRNNSGMCEMIPPNCGANEMADGQNCVCVDGYQRNNFGMCEIPPPPCSDFRERNEQGECSYDTVEYRHNDALTGANPLYAYEEGYHGQGVTVVVGEQVSRTHENLQNNVIGVSTGLDCSGLSIVFRKPALGEQYFHNHNCDEFGENYADALITIFGETPERVATLRLYHGNAVAGILGAPRNGLTMHGIAPSVKIIPIPWRGGFRLTDRTEDLQYIIDNKIPIVNHSTWYRATARSMSLFMKHYRDVAAADSDTIFVFAGGNAGSSREISPLNQVTVPYYDNEFEDNWLVAAAYNDRLGKVTSTRCGKIKQWCISARDYAQSAPYGPDGNDYSIFGLSSGATPVVSGALAVLKSAAPELPMTMIRQILLTTATDIGDDGIDEEFGWGVVNVSAGIEHIENLETAEGTALRDLRQGLPSEFSHLRGRLSDVSVALKITDDSYYNIPLSDIVGGGDSQKTSLGNAAKEMQADDSLSPENSGFGFNYANGDYDLHYAGGGENAFRFSGGLRHDDSQSSYIGEGGGIFSAENASDTGGYVKWTTKNYGGISAFGEYGRTQIKADYDSHSFVSKIKNARAEEWTAGFQYQNLFLHNDNLQFSARQESRISGGEMVLHYPVADGDSHKAFIGESVQTIRTETARIPIKQKPQTIYTAGYSQKTENSKWSAAAEWNSATNAKGVSFAVELQIR